MRTNRDLHPNHDWFVVCNDGDKTLGDEFVLIDGVSMPSDGPSSSLTNKHSMHHALALNAGCEFISNYWTDNRYLLICDPDFFVIPDHSDVIDHMGRNDLTFFGAPYWPDGKKRAIQDFPVAFCMYVDTWRVEYFNWNFCPVYDDKTYKDTGFMVYSKYHHIKSCFETLVPHGKLGIRGASVDVYDWGSEKFGLHVHAKLHLKGPSMIKRTEQICQSIGEYIENERNTLI